MDSTYSYVAISSICKLEHKATTINLCVWRQILFPNWGEYEANKQKLNIKTKHISYAIKCCLVFFQVYNVQNWRGKYNIAQSDSDIFFQDENASFILILNIIALIIYQKFWKLKEIAGKIFCLFNQNSCSNIGAHWRQTHKIIVLTWFIITSN